MTDNMLDTLGNIPSSVGSNAPTEVAFLPSIQIVTSLSEVAKNYKPEGGGEKPEVNNFWFAPPGGGACLGMNFLAVPLATRDHAIQTKTGSLLLESYNAPAKGSPPKTEAEKIYAQIQALPKQQPKEKIFNYYGGDVLLWVPNQTLESGKPFMGAFAVYFLHSTARPQLDYCNKYRGKLCKVHSHENNTQFTWYTPEFNPVMTPGQPMGAFDPNEFPIPAQQLVVLEVTKFLNPTARGENTPRSSEGIGVDGRAR